MKSPHVTVRHFGAGDRSGCLGIFKSNVPERFASSEEEDFLDFIDNLPGPYYVLEGASGDLVGCGGFAPAAVPSVAVFCWGMVRRDQQGAGLGKLLLRHRLGEIAALAEYRSVAIETSQHSCGFFERFGFVVSGSTPDGFAPGMDRIDMTLDEAALAQWAATG